MIPALLGEIVRTVIIMSISGGILVLLLLMLKPVVRHRLPKSGQYYFWLVALFAMLIPVSRVIVLPESVPNAAPVHAVVERNVVSYFEEAARIGSPMPTVIYYTRLDEGNNIVFESVNLEGLYSTPPPSLEPSIAAILSTIFMLIYPWTTVLILLYSIVSYAFFIKKLRRGNVQPDPATLDALNNLTKGKRTPNLIISSYAQTPMLIGLFSSTIVLPHSLILRSDEVEQYNEQLQSILRHELTHMRRFDIAFKWLSLFACAIHWFNPLVWILRRELDRICELSCDEVVINDMDTMARQSYGETLISVASYEKVPLPILRTTMCSEKHAVKERLRAIMKSKKHTTLSLVVSIIIFFAAVFTAGTVGAGSSYNATGVSAPLDTLDLVAHVYIDEMIATLYVREENMATVRPANILDIHINHFEMIFELNNALNYPVEMWRLDFIVQTNDIEDGNIRWGTFAPDDNGWIGKHMGWHDADVIMIFEMNPIGVEFLGTLGRWESYEVIDEASAEHALRSFLSNREFLSMESIPHVGVAHETHRIVRSLPLPDDTWFLNSIQIGADHGNFGYGAYTLTVFYDIIHAAPHWLYLEYMPGASFEENAERLFELIDNLRAITFSVNNLSASDISEYHYRWSITRESSAAGGGAVTSFRGPSRPFSAISVSNEVVLTVRSIEGFLHKYDVFWGDVDWRAMPIAFETNVTLTDVRWLELYPDPVDSAHLVHRVYDTLFQVDVLHPSEAFAVAWTYDELVPSRGISFVDRLGSVYHFALADGDAEDFWLVELGVDDEVIELKPVGVQDGHVPSLQVP